MGTGRFHPAEAGLEGSPFRLTDQQIVPENGVEVTDFERTPDLYADLQPTYASFRHRSDVVGVSDPMFREPYLLEDGQLIHDAYQQPIVARLEFTDQFGERRAVLAIVGNHPHTRGEHSLGVEIISTKGYKEIGETPSDEFRVAALTHDVGQTCWSHHGEAAFDDSVRQDWHDSRRREILFDDSSMGLANFLARKELDPERVLAEYDNPVLDAPRPDLCADRIEYLLRDGLTHGDIEPAEAHLLLDDVHLTSPDEAKLFAPLEEEGHLMTTQRFEELKALAANPDRRIWYCKSIAGAETFYRLMEILNSVYTGAEMGTIKMYTSRLLRLGMERKYITAEMVKTETDDRMLLRLARAVHANPQDREFCEHYTFLRQLGKPRSRPEVEAFILDHREQVEELQNPDVATTKQRWVDPFVYQWVRRQVTGEMTPVIRRLSYFKRLGYAVEGDRHELAQVAQRLTIQKPHHRPIVPALPSILEYADHVDEPNSGRFPT